MAEALGLHQPLYLHRPDPRDAAHVVAPQVDEHGVLRALFRVRAQLLLEAQVLLLRRAATARARYRAHRHLARLHLDEKLRRGPEQLPAAEPQVEVVRGGARGAQGAVQREAIAVRQLEALGKHHLEDVAGMDVLEGAPDGGLELLLSAGDRHRLGEAAFEEAGAVAAIAEEPGSEGLRRGCAQRVREPAQGESLQHAPRQRLGALARVFSGGQRPGPALPVVECDQLPHQQQLRFGKERVGAKPLREPLTPARAAPTEIADVPADKWRQTFAALCPLRFQRATQRLQRLRLPLQREPRLPGPHPDVAVASERSLEEEGVSLLLLVEKAEDAERRQQITGKLDGRGRSASKAGSGKGSSWAGRLRRMPARCKHMIEARAWRHPRGASRPRC